MRTRSPPGMPPAGRGRRARGRSWRSHQDPPPADKKIRLLDLGGHSAARVIACCGWSRANRWNGRPRRTRKSRVIQAALDERPSMNFAVCLSRPSPASSRGKRAPDCGDKRRRAGNISHNSTARTSPSRATAKISRSGRGRPSRAGFGRPGHRRGAGVADAPAIRPPQQLAMRKQFDEPLELVWLLKWPANQALPTGPASRRTPVGPWLPRGFVPDGRRPGAVAWPRAINWLPREGSFICTRPSRYSNGTSPSTCPWNVCTLCGAVGVF